MTDVRLPAVGSVWNNAYLFRHGRNIRKVRRHADGKLYLWALHTPSGRPAEWRIMNGPIEDQITWAGSVMWIGSAPYYPIRRKQRSES